MHLAVQRSRWNTFGKECPRKPTWSQICNDPFSSVWNRASQMSLCTSSSAILSWGLQLFPGLDDFCGKISASVETSLHRVICKVTYYFSSALRICTTGGQHFTFISYKTSVTRNRRTKICFGGPWKNVRSVFPFSAMLLFLSAQPWSLVKMKRWVTARPPPHLPSTK